MRRLIFLQIWLKWASDLLPRTSHHKPQTSLSLPAGFESGGHGGSPGLADEVHEHDRHSRGFHQSEGGTNLQFGVIGEKQRLPAKSSFGMVDYINAWKHPMSVHPVGPEKLNVEPSSRKLMAEHVFDHVSVAVSDGRGYGLQELLRPHVTLSHARAAWTQLPTSLAAVVIDEREHS